MKWYYVANGQQAGPIEETEFPALIRTGKLRADTLVWREGMADWEPFSKACPQEFAAASAPLVRSATEAVCAECGGMFDKSEMITHSHAYICAKCKPVFLQKLTEGVAFKRAAGDFHYAGFWIRLLARFVDGLIIVIPFAILAVVGLMIWGNSLPGAGIFVQLLIVLGQFLIGAVHVGYNIFFVGKYGATPGKMLCKIHVVTPTGEKINFGRATGRAFADLLSYFICNLLYLMVAFDEEKRALHDHICNTRVVYK